MGATLAARASNRDCRVDEPGDWTVIRGDNLPWADGAVYLGLLPGTELVFVPVHRRPDAPLDIVTAAVRARAGTGPVVMIPPDEADDEGTGQLLVLRP